LDRRHVYRLVSSCIRIEKAFMDYGRGGGVGRGLGVGAILGVGVCLGVAVVVAVGVGLALDSMVRTTSFVSYVTCAVTPAGAVIETFENAVPFSPPFAVNRVYCMPTIKGPPISVTSKFPSSPAMPPTITLLAASGITPTCMVAAGSKVRSPLIEMIELGVSLP